MALRGGEVNGLPLQREFGGLAWLAIELRHGCTVPNSLQLRVSHTLAARGMALAVCLAVRQEAVAIGWLQ